jgi:hypothetical protein
MQASVSYAQSKATRPQHVNKIFIATVPNIKELGIGPFLEAELESYGFEVVSRVSDAEAVLSLVSAKEVATTEYDMANIPNTTSDSFYRFEITSPNKGVIWKIRLKFGTMGPTAENKYVARRVAEKMAKKFKKK